MNANKDILKRLSTTCKSCYESLDGIKFLKWQNQKLLIYLFLTRSLASCCTASHKNCCWLPHPFGSLCMTKNARPIKVSFTIIYILPQG